MKNHQIKIPLKTFIIEFTYQNFLRPLLFMLNPDNVHRDFIKIGFLLGKHEFTRKLMSFFFNYKNQKLSQNKLNLNFINPVGLSAGFDKDGYLLNILSSTGFGFTELGTITFNSYKGNQRPWTYRLIKSKSILVNYGLKNEGVKRVSERIKSSWQFKKNSTFNQKDKNYWPINISIGKTNAEYTVEESAGLNDYLKCYKYLIDQKIGDLYTFNISCPNTYGGEPFTEVNKLDRLLSEVIKVRELTGDTKPIFLKMPINLTWKEFQQLCEIAVKYHINGITIGNLNKNRKGIELKDPLPDDIRGNLSGKPTEQLVNDLIFKTYQYYGDKLILIGVGGIFSAEDAYEKIKRGATLVELITGMIFEGPQLISEINQGLVKLLEQDGFNNISEAVGYYHKNSRLP